MSQQQIRVSPYYSAIRNVASEVGLRKCNERAFAGMSGSIGVWLWVDLTIKEIEVLKKRGEWAFGIPDTSTVKRRLNYLADPAWLDDGLPRPEDSPPLWRHLPVNVNDVDPSGRGHVRNQSAYQPAEGEPAQTRAMKTSLAPPAPRMEAKKVD